MSGDAWGIVVGVGFFVLIIIGFMFTGSNEADQAGRDAGYRSGAMWLDPHEGESDRDQRS